jgi:hypothetical protein
MDNNISDNIKSDDINILIEFIEDVFMGIEIKIYENLINKNKEQIKSSDAKLMGINMLEFYLSQITKSLASEKQEEDFDIIKEKFDKFSEILSLDKMVILNLITNVIMKSYTKLPRSKLVVSEDIDEYKNSLKDIFVLMRKYITFCIEEYINEIKKIEKEKKDENDNDEYI